MNVVAEVLDDVLSEARAVRREERDADRARINRFDPVGRNTEPHRCAGGFADGIDSRRLSQKLGKEKGVPGAPCVELYAIDLEAMPRLRDRDTPKADHPLRFVTVNANPVTENTLRFFDIYAGIFRDLHQ